MLCRDIIDVIERTYPKHAAMEWDNVGLLVGRTDKEVQKILVALDLDDIVMETAIECNVDMIVTHHPLIFSPLKRITDEHFIGNRVVTLLQHDISYYAMHTNYDAIRMGKLAGEMLGLKNAVDIEDGIGQIGALPEEMMVHECAELIKEKFQLEYVRVFGSLNGIVKNAAICPGSGKDFIGTVLQKNADIYITGDIDHHHGIDAVAQGLAIIDAGHYGLEHIFIDDIAEYLFSNLEGVRIEKAVIRHPFQEI